jgi:hypothetical protein
LYHKETSAEASPSMAGRGDDSATAFSAKLDLVAAKIDLAAAMLHAINARLDDHDARTTRVEKIQHGQRAGALLVAAPTVISAPLAAATTTPLSSPAQQPRADDEVKAAAAAPAVAAPSSLSNLNLVNGTPYVPPHRRARKLSPSSGLMAKAEVAAAASAVAESSSDSEPVVEVPIQQIEALCYGPPDQLLAATVKGPSGCDLGKVGAFDIGARSTLSASLLNPRPHHLLEGRVCLCLLQRPDEADGVATPSRTPATTGPTPLGAVETIFNLCGGATLRLRFVLFSTAGEHPGLEAIFAGDGAGCGGYFG